MLDDPGHHPTPFMADAMLGRLARWLRIFGYDTAYERMIADEVLIERVVRENRWLLTRDGYLAQRKVLRGRHTLLESDNLADQLRQLHQDLKIDLDMNRRRGYRCADCNVALSSRARQDARSLVPPFVAQRYREFLQCSQCRRAFWPGTHWLDLRGRLAAMMKSSTDMAEPP
jgi:hypothetical protein